MAKRILFVDDEQNVLDGLRRMLHPMSGTWDLRFALDAQQALAELAKEPFDAVVTDIRMPGMDGFALLLALKENEKTKDVPVIVLTGIGESDIKLRALELGASDLLAKPVNREDLIARLRSVLSLKARQDEIRALNRSLEVKVKERTAELEQSQQDIIWRLAKAAEYRDTETGDHVMRIACYCQVLGETLAMPKDFVERLFMASPLHDLGKIGVPDKILRKPATLTPEERKIMERHCAIGAAILETYPRSMRALLLFRTAQSSPARRVPDNPILKMGASIARTHHERWDGTGYPKGLKGEAIPIESRIVALADTYDALCFARPYKPPFSDDKTLAIMQEEADRHFDPRVYAVFEKQIDKFQLIKEICADETADSSPGTDSSEEDSVR